MKKTTIVFFILFVMTVFAFAAKPRIAIVDFEDKSGSAYGSWAIGTGVSDMLATTLFKSGKFDIYERKQMEAILKEQSLQLSGAMTTESAVKVGKLLGVKFLVVGSVDQFGQKETGVKAFGIGVKSTTAHVACDVRLIEVETGKLVAAEQGEGNASATGISTNYDNIAFGSNGFDQTIIGKATNKCVADLADKISASFAGKGLQGSIIKVASNGQIYINLGDDSGIKVGQVLFVIRKGEELIDPDTGESLGSDTEQIGTVKVTALKGKFSLGEMVDGAGKASAGDMVTDQAAKK
ncbi:MAG: CsgG/HfaB family protein [Rectinemataceae bacterium]|jgi:curli biogenesis system outer membrane secretion channel CsgG